MALLLAVPLGIAIALYLSMIAPPPVRAVVGPLVEMLAAIPSVILGFWGLLVLAPVHAKASGAPAARCAGLHPAVRPAADHRHERVHRRAGPHDHGPADHRGAQPRSLLDGPARAARRRSCARRHSLGGDARRRAAVHQPGSWRRPCLGLGRALGEAIAVTQVIGAGNVIHRSLFSTGDTLASRIAAQFPGAVSKLHISSLFYLASSCS